jgi:hypothetical protein
MTRPLLIAFLLLLSAGCAQYQLPPPPGDTGAKRFETVPDKSVIYLVRHPLEPSYVAPVVLDDHAIGSTYRGTYMRIELPAGTHVLRGMAGDSGSITLKTESGKLYFVEHRAYGYRDFTHSSYVPADPARGRSMVLGGQITALISQ